MASVGEAPAKLARLLETLESTEREEIVTWLLASRSVALPHRVLPELRRQIGSWLPAGEDSQLVTVRLPAEQHERLRTWCTEHNFTMAAVVRGLIERFLNEQGRGTPAAAEA